MSLRRDAEAHGLFVQAGALAAPLAPERENDDVTVGEIFYASALVWSTAAAARMQSKRDPAAPGPSFPDRVSLPGRPPLCSVRVTVDPMPNYPLAAQERDLIGAVVVRLGVNAAGEVRSHKVLAAVPSDDFARSVDNQQRTWTLTRDPDSSAGCRMETADRLVPVRFINP